MANGVQTANTTCTTTSVRVGLVQIENTPDVATNAATMLRAMQTLAGHGVDLIVFPECALTGFSAKSHTYDPGVFDAAMHALQAGAERHGMTAIVPAIFVDADQVLNGGMWFQKGEAHCFYKQGLTASEAAFFTPRADGPRVFECGGVCFGLLLCVEAEHAVDAYVGPVDVLLWPTYWGWTADCEWTDGPEQVGTPAIYRHIQQRRCPLLQANFSANHAEDGRASGPQGLSVVIDADNTCIARGPHRASGALVVDLVNAGSRVRVGRVESVGIA